MSYDIRAAVRLVIESTEVSDPGDIAVIVAQAVPEEQLRTVLAVVLRDYVRVVLHEYRQWHDADPPMTETPEPTPTAGKPAPPPNRSAKVAGYRMWGRVLAARVAVANNVWKHFGKCSVSDLDFLAAHRRQNAAESVAAAERYEKYAAAMAEAGAETVEDLPDVVIAAIESES